ncbi:histidinol dehydrogenase [Tersicoccus sp. Bi-70]|uniref:histidinol dehydrogenase n=1 Tax=Tersicoccus sp. Bi-70 TaxID=1897634 RepID=UPI0009755E7F|nr:histidinol dehydrogenase [Tersicoccus sp. Bi-70]OMH33271.1 histidinol dehydrogenase [Tersicoccus sp. Bi-70]
MQDLRDSAATGADLRAVMPRAGAIAKDATATVTALFERFQAAPLATVLEMTEQFDGVWLDHPRVPEEQLDEALARLDPQVEQALRTAIDRVRRFAEATRPADTEVMMADGARVANRWLPVSRVGLYVPGGLAVYPSSLVMNVVPAQAAGVTSIALASPPQKAFGGRPHPTILAAAAMLGIREVYAMGGAQAVAAFAWGLPGAERADGSTAAPLPAVDVITGPGNVFVATAKRLVRGRVGIDSEAGTTEIAILADETADPRFVAADLISQAEHDPNAASVLITDSAALVDAVRTALDELVPATRHAQRVATALGGPQSGALLVRDLDQGIAVCDAYAAEHLEIHTRDAAGVAARIRNAGAVFVGPWSPVSLGDYCAGSNHVLPTAGTAAYSSALNTTTFLKAVQYIDYGREGLAEVAPVVRALADAEDLPAHGDAVDIRFA